MEALRRHAFDDEGVSLVAEHDLLCAPDGVAFMVAQLKESEATHAVVAACSPKDRQASFEEALEQAGINKHMLQMANIREHCAWVATDQNEATRKAMAMMDGALRRVRLHESLETREILCDPDLLARLVQTPIS